METLIQEIYQILKDYRSEEGIANVRITPERIKLWILQFEENDRIFLLNELKNVFQKRYCSKSMALSFLKNIIVKLSEDLNYASSTEFLDNAHCLDLQAEGKSQKKMIELLALVLKKEFNYEIANIGNNTKKHYIYIDDVLCTGNTFYNNIKDWLDIEENGIKMLQRLRANEVSLKVVFIFIVSKNYEKKLGQFYHNIDKNFRNMLKTYAIHCIDAEVLQPIRGSHPDFVLNYEAKVTEQADNHAKDKNFNPYTSEFYRTENSIIIDKFFTSNENRIRFENILLKKGIEILDRVNVRRPNFRPLGYSLPSRKDFGSGALLFTWRNVPNNTPLTFWYSSAAPAFSPLFVNMRQN